MIKNAEPAMALSEFIIERRVAGRGIRRIISISNTKKITASRKNRVEKGRRAVFLGSKPHSKGDAFSRSDRVKREEALRAMAAVRIAAGTAVAIRNLIRAVSIAEAS